mmetsp:Transcript_34338/g.116510  ORF Transcript_34338/g.116510 Transcript_34338/m.116510 type:complete len:307 (+) Transcript_34338:478-1398(+)
MSGATTVNALNNSAYFRAPSPRTSTDENSSDVTWAQRSRWHCSRWCRTQRFRKPSTAIATMWGRGMSRSASGATWGRSSRSRRNARRWPKGVVCTLRSARPAATPGVDSSASPLASSLLRNSGSSDESDAVDTREKDVDASSGTGRRAARAAPYFREAAGGARNDIAARSRASSSWASISGSDSDESSSSAATADRSSSSATARSARFTSAASTPKSQGTSRKAWPSARSRGRSPKASAAALFATGPVFETADDATDRRSPAPTSLSSIAADTKLASSSSLSCAGFVAPRRPRRTLWSDVDAVARM